MDPIHQFEIKPLFGEGAFAFTNSSLFMVATVLTITLFLVLATRRSALVPGRWQSLAEMSYEFIANMVRDNVGSEGRRYFPFVFSIFMFVLFGNLLGMIPYSFTFTSHIIVTFALAMLVILPADFAAFERGFSAEKLVDVTRALRRRDAAGASRSRPQRRLTRDEHR